MEFADRKRCVCGMLRLFAIVIAVTKLTCDKLCLRGDRRNRVTRLARHLRKARKRGKLPVWLTM